MRPVAAPARFAVNITGGPGSSDPERIAFSGVPMIRLLMSALRASRLGMGSPVRRFGPSLRADLGPCLDRERMVRHQREGAAGRYAGAGRPHASEPAGGAEFGLKLHHEGARSFRLRTGGGEGAARS